MKIENKEKMIHFRATATEKARIQREAKKHGLRLSFYVRLVVLNALPGTEDTLNERKPQ